MFRVRLKLSINKVPEFVDCSRWCKGIDCLVKVNQCQEVQRLKMHEFYMSKVIVILRRDASFF